MNREYKCPACEMKNLHEKLQRLERSRAATWWDTAGSIITILASIIMTVFILLALFENPYKLHQVACEVAADIQKEKQNG